MQWTNHKEHRDISQWAKCQNQIHFQMFGVRSFDYLFLQKSLMLIKAQDLCNYAH